MSAAEKLFARTFFGSMSRFAVIFSFRRVAKLGLPAATPAIHQEWIDYAHQLFNDPENDELFVDKELALQMAGGVEAVGAQMAEKQINEFRASVDAASLVFAHSILDSVALDYCRVTALHSPSAWAGFVAERKVAVAELEGRSYDDLVQEKIGQFIDLLDRQSLLSKTDKLFQVCRPDEGFDPIHDYVFDRERLVALDEMRHTIVHGSEPVADVPNADADIWFMQQTASYLMALVNMRFDIKIDPQEMVKVNQG